jgi:hypothetical protein
MRKLLVRKDHDRNEDKDKKDKSKKRWRRKAPPKGGKSSATPKDADQRSKATKNNQPTRTTRSMTRMFNYYVEMK